MILLIFLSFAGMTKPITCFTSGNKPCSKSKLPVKKETAVSKTFNNWVEVTRFKM